MGRCAVEYGEVKDAAAEPLARAGGAKSLSISTPWPEAPLPSACDALPLPYQRTTASHPSHQPLSHLSPLTCACVNISLGVCPCPSLASPASMRWRPTWAPAQPLRDITMPSPQQAPSLK